MKFLRKGKNKDVYEDKASLCFVFSDRLSAFDVQQGEIKGRGELLARCTENFFRLFEKRGVKTSFIKRKDNKIWAKPCRVVPFEFIVRNVLAGSAFTRFRRGVFNLPEGMLGVEYEEFPKPFVEVSTKFEAKDRYGLSEEEVKLVLKKSIPEKDKTLVDECFRISEKLSFILKDVFAAAGFVLFDCKFEFGLSEEDELLLIDSFGPDEFRAAELSSLGSARLGIGKVSFFDKEFMREKLKQGEKLGLSSESVVALHGYELNERYEKVVFETEKVISKLL